MDFLDQMPIGVWLRSGRGAPQDGGGARAPVRRGKEADAGNIGRNYTLRTANVPPAREIPPGPAVPLPRTGGPDPPLPRRQTL
jgi:hypothetical protein